MRHRHRPAPLYQSLFRCDALCCLAVMLLGTAQRTGEAAGRLGRLGRLDKGNVGPCLVERSLSRAGTKVLRTGRFPPGGREGVVLFPVNAAQAGARAAALFSGEEALEQKKVRQRGQTVRAGKSVRVPSLYVLRIIYIIVYLLIKQRGRRGLWVI